jgi:type IV pilus assembly protein PilY1
MPELQPMTHTKSLQAALLLTIAGLAPNLAPAQSYTENFTGTTTNNQWIYLTGACLTMGTVGSSTSIGSPGAYFLPGCMNGTSLMSYYAGTPSPQFGGDTGTLPDLTSGALRFTDWFSQTGAILSSFSFPLTGPGAQGLQVSFTSVTYEGNSGGGGGDGADGMSFFLQDASYPADVGAFGGSLAYSCSNTNNSATINPNTGLPRGYDGLQGGFIGLGIDEYGNFLNQGDNTVSGWGYQWGRIGLRGPGSTTWAWLSSTYPSYYPSTGTGALSVAQSAAAVQQACSTGYVWDWSNPAAPAETGIQLTDYTAIAESILPPTKPIANESATTRAQAIPIVYNLKIQPSSNNTSLLSLSYSYNGGALQNVITNQDITQGGTIPVPANVRFGFAGSTGGSRNIHEIMCFQATPANVSQSSAGLNQKQIAQVQNGTQAYFAFYNPTTLAGSLTSQYIGQPVGDTNPNDLVISANLNWDGSCVLTGLAAGQVCDNVQPPATAPTGQVQAQGYTPGNTNSVIGSSGSTASLSNRVILSWKDGSPGTGIPFEWANLTAAQQSALDAGDAAAAVAVPPDAPPAAYSRLNFLRGDRSNEQTPTSTTTYTGVFRSRASVLGDIIDSSPTWVGPPNTNYPNTWGDQYNATGDTMAENSGETYGTFASVSSPGFETRENVVYAGANDGMLHGFRSGYFSTPTTYQPGTNDGLEVLAYVPGRITSDIQTAALPPTGTLPVYNSPSNYSDPQYGHRFDVDAPPGTGDLFYNGTWHTWLVGGLGPGGNAIYALDVTDPTQFTEGNAGSIVIGEWSTWISSSTTTSTTTGGVTTNTVTPVNPPVVGGTTLTCVNDTGTACGNHLGKTYGVPQIRRFHNGSWGAVFGNGQGSVGGDGGIYVMLVDPSSGAVTFYYLSTSTGSQTNPNGIDYTAPADLDGDHIVDYVYAGDLLGHIWRFDLTSTNAAQWGVTNAHGVSINAPGSGNPVISGGGAAAPLFSTPAYPINGNPGIQPITSQVVVAAIANPNGSPRIMIEFGTGEQTPMTNYAPLSFLPSQQSLYGIWDWNLGNWNFHSAVQFDSLPANGVSGPATPLSGVATLQQQTITGTTPATASGTGSDYRTVSDAAVCWADNAGCAQYGWYLNLVSGNAYSPDPAIPQNGNANYANAPVVWEQVIYNPTVTLGTFVVNTTIPGSAAAIMCYSSAASGWTMALNPATGGALTSSFFDNPGSHTPLNVTSSTTTGGTTTTSEAPVSGASFGGTGSVSIIQGGNQYYGLMQTGNGTPVLMPANPQGNYIGSRLTWIEKR